MKRSLFGAILVGFVLAGLLAAIVLIVAPGHYVYVPGVATSTPIATPMDVTLKMRGPDGEIDQIWLCKYDRGEGWVCQLEEEPHGETLDK